MLLSILLGKGDVQFLVDILNSERRETGGNRAIGERFDQLEAGVIHFHDSIAEIGGVDESRATDLPDGKALVDGAKRAVINACGGASGVIHYQYRVEIYVRGPPAD